MIWVVLNLDHSLGNNVNVVGSLFLVGGVYKTVLRVALVEEEVCKDSEQFFFVISKDAGSFQKFDSSIF